MSTQPLPIEKSTAKDFFLHFAAIIALYVSLTNFLQLVFIYIEKAFPEVIPTFFSIGSWMSAEGIRSDMATLFIAFIAYVILVFCVQREYQNFPAKYSLGVRKWLIYLTLFVALTSMAIDLMVLIKYFLNGEFTTRFLLKVAVVFLVFAAIYNFYYCDLKQNLSVTRLRVYGLISLLAVFSAIAYGFTIVGSPAQAYKENLDVRRVRDLQAMQSQIVNFWRNKNVLPKKLMDLNDNISGYSAPMDPITQQAYGYQVKSANSFQLCATFAMSNIGQQSAGPYIGYPEMWYVKQKNWQHPAGYYCFDRDIDGDLYKGKK